MTVKPCQRNSYLHNYTRTAHHLASLALWINLAKLHITHNTIEVPFSTYTNQGMRTMSQDSHYNPNPLLPSPFQKQSPPMLLSNNNYFYSTCFSGIFQLPETTMILDYEFPSSSMTRQVSCKTSQQDVGFQNPKMPCKHQDAYPNPLS